ncbi:MAG TPA: YggT family protein [Desulfosporosinus sp.]|nr:YggT family protein [Desulfosporosinus sp.]
MISLIAQVIDKVITILIYAIVIRAFLSFLPQLRSNKLSMLLNDVTDPILKPFQRFQIVGKAGTIDFSPIIAIIVLDLIQALIVRPFF